LIETHNYVDMYVIELVNKARTMKRTIMPKEFECWNIMGLSYDRGNYSMYNIQLNNLMIQEFVFEKHIDMEIINLECSSDAKLPL
jgi:hypothetical protein